MNLLRLLGRALKPYWWLVALIIVMQLVEAVCALLLPTFNGRIINEGVMQGDTGRIWALSVPMLLINLAQGALAVLVMLCSVLVATRVGRDLRQQLYVAGTAFSEQDVQRFGASSLITRNTNDVQQLQQLIQLGLAFVLTAPMLAIGGIVLAVRADAQLAWVIVVAVPLMLAFMAVIMSFMVPAYGVMQERLDALNRILREQLTGVRVIRAFVREPVERERFNEANERLRVIMVRIGTLFAVLYPGAMLLAELASVAVVWIGAHRVDAGSIEVGTMVAFLQYLMLVLGGVLMASFVALMMPRAFVAARRINEVVVTSPAVPHVAGGPEPRDGSVEFRGVSFQYPGAEAPVLHDLSFRVEPGQTVAVIGGVGSGKTTVLGLIARLFDPTAGQVLVGGVDTTEADTDALWANLGLVPQRAYLFSGTVASNLRYGNEDATDEQLWQALQIAQAADFVREKGLDAPVAQGGTNFSGGQRQRLCIARAIVANPRILLFDDSFSALDTATDARLRTALERELARVTRIVVAQRIATVERADRILVLEAGRLVGTGTHAELLETNETYREIVASQMAEEVR